MAALLSGLMPVKTGVDHILAGCQQIMRSRVIPGAEQVCGPIVALATSLLPMAAQQVLQPGGGAGAAAGAMLGGAPIPAVGAPPAPGAGAMGPVGMPPGGMQ